MFEIRSELSQNLRGATVASEVEGILSETLRTSDRLGGSENRKKV
jgi:hypothetical protein